MAIGTLSKLYKRASQGAEGDWKTILKNAVKALDGHSTEYEEDMEHAQCHVKHCFSRAEQEPDILLSFQTDAGTQNVMERTGGWLNAAPKLRILGPAHKDVLQRHREFRIPRRYEMTQELLKQDEHRDKMNQMWDEADKGEAIAAYIDYMAWREMFGLPDPLDEMKAQTDKHAYATHMAFLSDLVEQHPDASPDQTSWTETYNGFEKTAKADPNVSQIRKYIIAEARRCKEDLNHTPTNTDDPSYPHTLEA